MLLQNRKHVRQKKIFKNKFNNFMFKTTTKPLTNKQKQKITIHKKKKTETQGFILNVFDVQNKFNFQKQVKQIYISELNICSNVLTQNFLGILKTNIFVSGYNISSKITSIYFYTHKMTRFNNINILKQAINCVNNLIFFNKILKRNGFLLISLTNDNTIKFKLNKNTYFLQKSEFFIGKSLKDKTNAVGITSRVRGIAKNPVDHPNGGRANTKGSFKTPWGKIAKNNK